MLRLCWLTDTHFDFIRERPDIFDLLMNDIKRLNSEAVVLTGDIAEGATWSEWLIRLRDSVGIPVYFVLGNHDYWGMSFAKGEVLAQELSQAAPHSPKWLTSTGIVKLTETTSLVGVDGWYDCNGMTNRLHMFMNDWFNIEEFKSPYSGGMYVSSAGHPEARHIANVSYGRADDAGKKLEMVISKAFKEGALRVICATHVPPFCEASRHNGNASPPETMPLYSAPVIGARLSYLMENWPDRQLTILSGHTHERTRCRIMPNLEVFVGASRYGSPRVEDVLDVP